MMKSIKTIPLVQLESPEQGVRLLLDELGDWLEAAFEEERQQPWQGIHDEATFVTAWSGYYALTKDEKVLSLANTLRDYWRQWAESDMLHGYHPKQEAHHGPEHYIIFLDWLYKINPEDQLTQEAILNAAHHIGNWVAETPAWYNWQDKRFVSNYLGTAFAGDEGLNIIEHLRFVYLALRAYNISHVEHYLEFACQYAGEWAEAIITQDEIPLYLDANQTAQADFETVLNTYLGAGPKDFSPISRLEHHVANGTPRLFMRLWQRTGDARFAQAAKRLVLPMLPELSDPYSNPLGTIFSEYRRAFEDTSLDVEIMETIGVCPDLSRVSQLELGIDPEVNWDSLRGFGKRRDMPAWYLIDKVDQTETSLNWLSPAGLALAFEIEGDEEWAMAALTLALAKLRLARQVYRGGRHHGCTARSIAAICRGHGRCWGVGDVSGVLNNPTIVGAFGRNPVSLPGLITN